MDKRLIVTDNNEKVVLDAALGLLLEQTQFSKISLESILELNAEKKTYAEEQIKQFKQNITDAQEVIDTINNITNRLYKTLEDGPAKIKSPDWRQ